MGELKIAEVTLGCRANAFDTASILEEVQLHNKINLVQPNEKPDFFLVNTCAVTQGAERDCRKAIKKLKKNNPQAKVIVTGCYAQLSSSEIAKNLGVDYVVGTSLQHMIPGIIEASLKGTKKRDNIYIENIMKQRPKIYDKISSFVTHTRAFLKIQDGCNEFCTFCIIPFTRGRSRIVPITIVIDEIKRLIDRGIKEVVLTGIHLGDYREYLIKLIQDIATHTSLPRLRLSSIEPFDVSIELLDCLKEAKNFMPYFHLPLQSGDDAILKKMKRPYTTSYFEKLVIDIRSRFPDAFIGLDVMVGFPGETHICFERTFQFLNSIFWSKAHVFPYSQRKGTKAVDFENHVLPEDKKNRVARVMRLSEQRLKSFYESQCGKTFEVLVETCNGKVAKGFTPNYMHVEFESFNVTKNQIVPIFLEKPLSFRAEAPLSSRVGRGIDISSPKYKNINHESYNKAT